MCLVGFMESEEMVLFLLQGRAEQTCRENETGELCRRARKWPPGPPRGQSLTM